MTIKDILTNKINFFRDCLLERFQVSDLMDYFSGYNYVTLEKPLNKYNLSDLISHKVLSDVLSEVCNPSNNKRVVNYYVFVSYGKVSDIERPLFLLSKYLKDKGIDSLTTSRIVGRGIRNEHFCVIIKDKKYIVTICDMYVNGKPIVIEDNPILFIEKNYLKHFQDDLLNWNGYGLQRLVNSSKIKFTLEP